MPSIVVLNDAGNVLFQNIEQSIEDLVKAIQDGDVLPGFLATTPEVRINGLIILAQQSPTPNRRAPALTQKQVLVLQLLARAMTPEQVALKLGLSEATIRMHISALKKKFKTDSRDQMMAMAGSLGLCDPFESGFINGSSLRDR
jgi:DNA-binding NarL/FixJ family response regulator